MAEDEEGLDDEGGVGLGLGLPGDGDPAMRGGQLVAAAAAGRGGGCVGSSARTSMARARLRVGS